MRPRAGRGESAKMFVRMRIYVVNWRRARIYKPYGSEFLQHTREWMINVPFGCVLVSTMDDIPRVGNRHKAYK